MYMPQLRGVMPQLKVLNAAAGTRDSQLNKYISSYLRDSMREGEGSTRRGWDRSWNARLVPKAGVYRSLPPGCNAQRRHCHCSRLAANRRGSACRAVTLPPSLLGDPLPCWGRKGPSSQLEISKQGCCPEN